MVDNRSNNDAFVSFAALLICFSAALLFSGCGYRLETRGDLPFESVSIGKIENRTHEPKMEDVLNRRLSETLMEYGFRVDRAARYRIEVYITRFELRTLSEKELTASEYETDITGRFRLLDTVTGSSTPYQDIRSPFVSDFSTTGSLVDVLSRKEISIAAAMKDISQEIVRSMIYKGPLKWEKGIKE